VETWQKGRKERSTKYEGRAFDSHVGGGKGYRTHCGGKADGEKADFFPTSYDGKEDSIREYPEASQPRLAAEMGGGERSEDTGRWLPR